MSSAWNLTLILILSLALCVLSAVAGALWYRLRSVSQINILQLARDLAERQRALERLIEKFEVAKPRKPVRLAPTLRFDSARARAEPASPTLISVPDLSVHPGKTTEVAADMARRFGAIWNLADAGQSPEAIARSSGQPVGQVELILALRNPRG